jgi:HEAT repeat protein
MVSRIGEAAVPTLIESLKDEHFERPDVLYSILGYIGGPAAVQALLGYLRDSDPEIRSSATYALGSTKDIGAVPTLREAMNDQDVKVRQGVTRALRECGGATTVQDLLDLLHDPEGDVRHSAAVGLAEICALKPLPAVVEAVILRLIDALIHAIDDPNGQVMAFASKALDNLADARAIPGLIDALGQPGAYIEGIKRVLENLGKIALPAVRQAMNDSNELVRLTALEFIYKFGDAEDAQSVAERLRDANPDVRLRAMWRMGPELRGLPVIQQALIERLQDAEEDVCLEAIELLRQIRNVSAVPHLVECLKVEALAPSAADALAGFDTREAAAALRAWRRNKKE